MHSKATHQELFVVLKSKYGKISDIRRVMQMERRKREMRFEERRIIRAKTKPSRRCEDIQTGDIHRCCEIIESHGGEVEDILRHYPVVSVMIPIENISALEMALKEAGYVEMIFPGLQFEEIREEGVEFPQYKVRGST